MQSLEGRGRAYTVDNRLDLAKAVVVVPAELSLTEARAVDLLIDEVEKRTLIRWPLCEALPSGSIPVVLVGQVSSFAALVDRDVVAGGRAEGFSILIQDHCDAPTVSVIGNDARGVLYGIGYLLRHLRMARGQISLDADLEISTAPRYPLRGHQLGYRDKTNSYCGWDLAQWEQYVRDLVVFGANAIELIPPRSDDNLDSVHFPLPPLETMAGVSQIADDYGIDVWIWYPAMDEDYSDPATIESALEERREVFGALPRINAVFTPGGDPGHTRPKLFLPFLKRQAELLQTYHPGAQTWVSPQGFSQEWMDEFLDLLGQDGMDWLSGVVHGPWVHMAMDEFRAVIPARYPIRNYPDITHCVSCQFPVPDWDVAYALTEGREPINPRPLDQATILHTQAPTIGFLTYSEGCNDDVNKCLWSSLGWDPDKPVIEILREYSRYYLGEPYADDFAQGLLALERNWRGPLIANAGVDTTLLQFQAMEAAASPQVLKNWRFQQGLYRAYYDAYVRSRLLYETGLEAQAMDRLRQAERLGSLKAMAAAERILDRAVQRPVSTQWWTRLFQLAEALFQSVHMQLSVPLYRGQHERRGANLDGCDFPLNNGPWLKVQFAEIRTLGDEETRLARIRSLVEWTNPGPGGYYDDLSSDFQRAHLVRVLAFREDPASLCSPARRYPYTKEEGALRLAWRSYTGSLRDAPFEMHYPDLDPRARYHVRIVYSRQATDVQVRLEANEGLEVHPFILKPEAYRPVEFDVPQEATQEGHLTLRWRREPGQAGVGTGCDVCEVWLIKV
jgi:hypothetical protein